MRVITIEQIENGGSTKVIEKISEEEQNEIYSSNYLNALTIFGDLKKFAFKEGNIYSKQGKDNIIVLKREDGAIINLVNFNHDVLRKEIEKKISQSFKSFLNKMDEQEYDSVYLTASKNRSNFNFISSSPSLNEETTVFIEFELDDNEQLTEVSYKLLNEFLQKELRNWFRIFIFDDKSNVLKVYYDGKTIIVNPSLIKYVKPQVEEMQQVYLDSIEKVNIGRGL